MVTTRSTGHNRDAAAVASSSTTVAPAGLAASGTATTVPATTLVVPTMTTAAPTGSAACGTADIAMPTATLTSPAVYTAAPSGLNTVHTVVLSTASLREKKLKQHNLTLARAELQLANARIEEAQAKAELAKHKSEAALATVRIAQMQIDYSDDEGDNGSEVSGLKVEQSINQWLDSTIIEAKKSKPEDNETRDNPTTLPAGATITAQPPLLALQPPPPTSRPALHTQPVTTVQWQPNLSSEHALLAPPETRAVSWQPTQPLLTKPLVTSASNAHNLKLKPPEVSSAFYTAPTIEPKTDIQELASAITNAVQAAHRTPRCTELPTFNGAYEDWLTYRAAYYETASTISPLENMARLRRSLRGPAKEAVQGLLIAGADPTLVIKALETRFGRPNAIVTVEMERLRSLQRLTESPTDVCIFATKVMNIVSTLQALNCDNYMYNPEITKGLVEKLTPTLRNKWYEFASTQPQQEPELSKFSRFMKREAEICSPFAPPENVNSSRMINATPHRQQRIHTTQETRFKCPICKQEGHTTSGCKKFTEQPVNVRWDQAKENKLCFRCLRYRTRKHSCKSHRCNIDGCIYRHNKLLHTSNPKNIEDNEKVNSAWAPRISYLKMIPLQVSGPAGVANTFALLDDGSTITLIDADLADKIGVTGPNEQLHIIAFDGEKSIYNQSHRVKFMARGNNHQEEEIEARTVKNLEVAPQKLPKEIIHQCKHLQGLPTYDNAKPKILIGQDNWHLLLATETKTGPKTQPVASLTRLGWVIHGSHSRALGHRINFIHHYEDQLDNMVKEYINLDNLFINPIKPKNDPEERALKILERYTERKKEGKYQTALLWKNEEIRMPDNYENTLKRLHSIEKKIDGNQELKRRYNEQMDALLTKGYAEPAPPNPDGKIWFLPHFAVINPMKPEKLRIVHDAAAKTKGTCLNDQLLTGPDLLQSLPGVIMKFRQYPVAITADISEMFMQIELRPEDRDVLRYLWRGNRRDEHPPEQYRMKSLIFGASSSPATAIYVKNINAEKFRDLYPKAVEAIQKKHYVDDYLDSFETEEEAIKIATAVKNIHQHAHFELKKWASNSHRLLKALGEAEDTDPVNLKGDTTERVLGLIWKPKNDQLAFNLNLARIPSAILENETPTKREALRIVMSLFDPLGLVSPVTIKAKQILQEIWRHGTGWDEPINSELSVTWTKWLQHLKNLACISIPRAYPGFSTAKSIQLHVFTDASESAYATALYWRTEDENRRVRVNLITAKAKVAPLKVTSIPRLELQAAVLGTRMATAVREEHEKKPESTTYWTDSRTTLSWIRTGSKSFKPYVAHRIAAIEEHSKTNEWRWIPTKLNIADDATRNVPENFSANHRWFNGPDFLYEDPSMWPTEEKISLTETGEEKTCVIINKRTPDLHQVLPEVTRFSRWERYLRATARVLQFIELCNSHESVNYNRTKKHIEKDPDWKKMNTSRMIKKTTKPIEPQKKYKILSPDLLRRAEYLIFRNSQEDSFKEEIKTLKNGNPIPRGSRLFHLSIHLSNDGLIKLQSRIEAVTDVPNSMKNPIIIDGDHQATKLWIEHVHRQMHHAGVEATLNECRQRHWVLRLRSVIKMIIKRCLWCRMKTATPPQPITGDLPKCRLAHHQRPFTYTGLDYFGPLTVTVGRSKQKRYVAIFTCLTTRAIHLELVQTLNTDSAIMALRRMIARRGCPKEIWSDNGTNFHGADKELRRALNNATQEEASKKMIDWKFIPPGAPFMGGSWERMVRSVKTALSATLKERSPSEETLETLLAEAEHTVNSRPLTHVSVNPEDPEALTPNHFLIGGPGRLPLIGEFCDRDLKLRDSWRTSQRLADMFWVRWLHEYLPELRNRREPHSKGATLKIGSLVQVVDSNLPRNVWIRGKVCATYPGPDGVVRTVDITTKGGILRRPVKRVIVIPVEEDQAAPQGNASSTEPADAARREYVQDK